MTSVSLQNATPTFLRQVIDWASDTLFAVLNGFKTHNHLYAFCVLVYVASVIECMVLGLEVNYRFVPMVSGSILALLAPVIFVWLIIVLVQHVRSGAGGSPSRALGKALSHNILAPQRVSNALHAMMINSLFFIGFVAMKKAIPALNPFDWDQTFMEIDRTLHFGRLPHEWFIPSFGTAEYLFAINMAYNVLWFLGVMACLFWYGFSAKDSFLRQRYLMTYVTTMTLGTAVLGSIFSSVGPCFSAGIVPGIDPYDGLMNTLRAANDVYPLWALDTQQALWSSYANGGGDIEGISAMPSMHVATAVLFVLLANATKSAWFKFSTRAFAVVIFIGSFVLGWHYAIDGYAGLAVVLFCWWACGKFLRWRFPEMA
jgi:hypothetical protein